MSKNAKYKKIINAKSQKGITLTVLVITIIVMLTLASATINLVIGEGGILEQSQKTKKAQEEKIKKEDTEVNTLIEKAEGELKSNWQDASRANPPKLSKGMVPVKWNGTNWVVTNQKDNEWFDYSKKKWANIMLRDGLEVKGIKNAENAYLFEMQGKEVTKVGSMFVWIPRYAYQITSGYHQSGADINSENPKLGAGNINIDFMIGTTNTSVTGRKEWDNKGGLNNWNIHPAFNYSGTVEGIWVAKFEASQSDAKANSADYQNNTGGTTGILKIQPGVNSWRNISASKMYDICLNYEKDLNSHLMKNTEWGACTYLTQSTYGKNEEVWLNNSSSYITGSCGEYAGAEIDKGTVNYIQGKEASTTGNIYGIYDMAGGAWDCVSAYVNNEHTQKDIGNYYTEEYGKNLIDGKYYTKDIYSIGKIDGCKEDYDTTKENYGDALYETSSNENGAISWYMETSCYPHTTLPFFVRGGGYSNSIYAGVFAFTRFNGIGNWISFRPTLIVK